MTQGSVAKWNPSFHFRVMKPDSQFNTLLASNDTFVSTNPSKFFPENSALFPKETEGTRKQRWPWLRRTIVGDWAYSRLPVGIVWVTRDCKSLGVFITYTFPSFLSTMILDAPTLGRVGLITLLYQTNLTFCKSPTSTSESNSLEWVLSGSRVPLGSWEVNENIHEHTNIDIYISKVSLQCISSKVIDGTFALLRY